MKEAPRPVFRRFHSPAPSPFHFLQKCLVLLGVLLPASFLFAEDYAHTWIQPRAEEIPQKVTFVRAFTFETPESLPCESGHNCRLSIKDGVLAIECTGMDPYFSMPEVLTDCPTGKLLVRFTTRGDKIQSIYWTDEKHPGMIQDLSASASERKPSPDGDGWQTVDVEVDLKLPIQRWRIDPASKEGFVEIKRIEFLRVETDGPQIEILPLESVLNPPESGSFPKEAQTLRLSITNPKKTETVLGVNHREETFQPEETRIFTYETDPKKAVDSCVWWVSIPDFPLWISWELEVIHDVEITPDWRVTKGEAFDFCLAPDESMAFLVRDGRKIAALTHLNLSKMPIRVRNSDGFSDLEFEVDGSQDLPVIRLPGRMTFASVPGVELLEKGEWSSSRADFWTRDHLRVRPKLHALTQHWLGVITEDGAFRLRWSDPKFQPVFAVPNYFDSTPDARFSLEMPRKVEGEDPAKNPVQKQTVRLEFSSSTDEAAFLKAGLWPEIQREMAATDQDSPRKAGRENFAIYREQLENGPLHTAEGWGHCKGWNAAPFSDQASALWRIGGNVPDLQFIRGGAHVGNGSIFFVRDQAERWLTMVRAGADNLLRTRGADGYWRYAGKYDVTHWESTTLGTNAQPIFALLQAWAATGNAKYLGPALESLALCRRFHVARGAQCWEMPLHTPDPLAAAYAIRACVLAYRATGDPVWLKDAERWALDGATYVYLWDDPSTPEPFQYGAYIGVLGATNWKAPNWIGLPVQWIGTVYAYALLDLAEVLPQDSEEAKVWYWIAEQITNAAERQVYPNGPSAGLLPDSVNCVIGVRNPADINPAVPIALRLRLSGKPASLCVEWNDRHHVVAPFPFTLNGDSVEFTAKPETPFQYLLDGEVKEAR